MKRPAPIKSAAHQRLATLTFEHTQPANFCAADFENRRPLFAKKPTLRQRITRAIRRAIPWRFTR